jgi:hypothetical protein
MKKPGRRSPRHEDPWQNVIKRWIYFLLFSSNGMRRVRLLTPIVSQLRPRIQIQRILLSTARQQPPQGQTRPFTADMVDHSTLVKPPPIDPCKSAIENVLELTELSEIAPVRLPDPSHHPHCLHSTYYPPRTSSPTPDPSGTHLELEESTAAP